MHMNLNNGGVLLARARFWSRAERRRLLAYSDVYHMHSTMDNISQFNPPMANMINDMVLCLQQGIDVISAELKCWESQLPFLIHEFGTPLSDHTMVQQDLLQFTKKMRVGQKFYFSIVKYRIDGTKLTLKSSKILLTKDLQRAALSQGGYIIISNGTRKNKSGEVIMRLRCNASKVYSNKKEKASKKASCEYRPSSLHNDRKNTRGPEGKNMVRRTNTTSCAVKKELAYKMFFAVSWDQAGFFFSAGNWCADHNNHIHLNQNETRFPSKLIESLERDVIESCRKANALNSTGRNVNFVRTGALLSSTV